MSLGNRIPILLLVSCILGAGLTLSSSTTPVEAQTTEVAAERCSQHHRFGARPVDIAKTADLSRVLARASWGYNERSGICYLVLDSTAVEVLRASADRLANPVLSTIDEVAAVRCSQHHRFGARPVDIAKTADLSRVLARASWGYNERSGICYLVLDTQAVGALRAYSERPALSGVEVAAIAREVRDRLQRQAISPDSSQRDPCARSRTPDNLSGLVEILRIHAGCLEVQYEPLGGRSVSEVWDEYREDPTFVSADLPIQMLRVDNAHASEAANAQAANAPYNWHLDAVSARELQQFDWKTGLITTVAVLDTGVDRSHAALSGKVDKGKGGIHQDGSPNTRSSNSPNSHGTHVAGTIAAIGVGIAPSARIYPINIELGDNASDVSLAEALTLNFLSPNVKVVNLSIGSPNRQCSNNYKVLFELLEQSGIVAVASAGNSGRYIPTQFPANCNNVIAVSATNSSNRIASRYTCAGGGTSIGPFVDIAAPGDCINSTVVGGGYGVWSGTSMAAPVVSAAVAHLFARCPSATPAEIREALKSSADNPNRNYQSARDDSYGYGIVKPLDAVEHLYDNTDCIRQEEEEPDTRSVRLSIGSSASDQANCATRSANCRWLRIELRGSGWNLNGNYETECWNDGVNAPWSGGGWARGHARFVNAVTQSHCWYGIVGSTVQVTVDGVQSNRVLWSSASPGDEPGTGTSVLLSVGRDARGDSSCSSVHCNWFDIQLTGSGWNPSANYFVQCGHNGIPELSAGPQIWRERSVTFSGSRNGNACFFGYPGREVYVVINGVKSNTVTWPRGDSEPGPAPDNRRLRISWGSDASNRGDCPANTNCRNLNYEYIGDWGGPPYTVRCWHNGQAGFGPFQWTGRPHTGCYYWGGTALVVIDGIRSNTLEFDERNDPPQRQLRISWGSDASNRGDCPANTNCRNLNYEYIGDWGGPPYTVRCWHNGQAGFGPFQWTGRPHTGCYYWGGTALVVIDGIRSNAISW